MSAIMSDSSFFRDSTKSVLVPRSPKRGVGTHIFSLTNALLAVSRGEDILRGYGVS